MSQTNTWLADKRDAMQKNIDDSKTLGPSFGANGPATSFWHDQVFERNITPSGSVECGQPLLCGHNAQGLFVALNASPKNGEAVKWPAGSTVTVSFEVADDENGTFEAAGPTSCITAPPDGLETDPGDTAFRIALCQLPKPWLKVKLDFTGAITGGTLICGLGYAAR